jgi:hypothetical protein
VELQHTQTERFPAGRVSVRSLYTIDWPRAPWAALDQGRGDATESFVGSLWMVTSAQLQAQRLDKSRGVGGRKTAARSPGSRMGAGKTAAAVVRVDEGQRKPEPASQRASQRRLAFEPSCLRIGVTLGGDLSEEMLTRTDKRVSRARRAIIPTDRTRP